MKNLWAKPETRWVAIALGAALAIILLNLVLAALVSFGVQLVLSGTFGLALGWFGIPAAAKALDLYPFA